jgi:hypothetical protein
LEVKFVKTSGIIVKTAFKLSSQKTSANSGANRNECTQIIAKSRVLQDNGQPKPRFSALCGTESGNLARRASELPLMAAGSFNIKQNGNYCALLLS